MISWGTILYGAALAATAAAGLGLVFRVRSPVVVVVMALSAAGGSIGRNAILRATHAEEFFTDAPIAIFPASWQDFGSGVFTLATASVLLGLGPLHNTSARGATTLALLAGAGAFSSTSTSTDPRAARVVGVLRRNSAVTLSSVGPQGVEVLDVEVDADVVVDAAVVVVLVPVVEVVAAADVVVAGVHTGAPAAWACCKAARVWGPTTPSTVRPLACWKLRTAASVTGP